MDQETFKQMELVNGDYAIYRYLDISTGHITKNDADLLRNDHEPDGAFLIGKYSEGFILSLGEYTEVSNVVGREFSKEFYDILNYAQLKGCCLLRLDADGMEFPNLPTFDW